MTSLRFGVFIPQGWTLDLVGIDPVAQWATMKRLAQRADAGPWESIWVFDHFHTVPVPTTEATHEAWTLMSAFAAVTDRVRLGQMCSCMSYRNPMYLAKVAATVDAISGGRVEMGIGAGWYEHEWLAYGYGFPEAKVRLQMLDEGVQIMRQAWSEGEATFAGKHYQVNGAICRPLPIQPEGIPMWIAGGGEKVTLKIAAKYAQYTNFDGNYEAFKRKSDLLAGHCSTVGTDFEAITRSTNFNITIGATEKEAEDRLRAHAARLDGVIPQARIDAGIADYRNNPGFGTPEQIAEKIAALKDIGMGYLITRFTEAAYDTSGMEMFEKEVIPALA